jgi:LmbE family N-acetylglucosaminyl deacetylase
MKVLVAAPHADDETLGCGGTIARHIADGDHVTVAIMTGHGGGEHFLGAPELWQRIRKEALSAMAVLGVSDLKFFELPAVMVADEPTWKVNMVAEELLTTVMPDVLYVPFPFDLHRDHREIYHALSIAWRPNSSVGRGVKEILAYEVPSETHWNTPYLEPGFLPTKWVNIGNHLETKCRALECYQSQIPEWPHARSIKAVSHLAHWRGSQVGMESAECFIQIRTLS